MRLSPQRLALRAVLLAVAGGFAVVRALEDGRKASAPGLEAGAALFHARVALVEWILAGLAFLTAAAALVALRRPARRRLLQLGGPPPGGPEVGAGSGSPPAAGGPKPPEGPGDEPPG